MLSKNKSFLQVAVLTIVLSVVWTSLSRLSNYAVFSDYNAFFQTGKSALWHVALPMAITYGVFIAYMVREKRVTQIYQPQPKLDQRWMKIVFGIITGGMVVYSLDNLYISMSQILENWNGDSLTRIMAALVATMVVGLTEESVFRGYALTEMRRSHGELQSMILATVLFGLWHFPNIITGAPLMQSVIQVFSTMMIGSGLYVTMRFTRTIFGSMAMHWLWDFAVVIAP